MIQFLDFQLGSNLDFCILLFVDDKLVYLSS